MLNKIEVVRGTTNTLELTIIDADRYSLLRSSRVDLNNER